jgi:hypothetical protein
MNPLSRLPLVAVPALCGCSSMAYFEHRESRPFIGQGMSVAVSREIFDAHPELRDGTVLIVPDTRSLAWKPDHRAIIHFFATSSRQIEFDRIEVTSGDPPATAVLKLKYSTTLSKDLEYPGLFEGGLTAVFEDAKGAGEVLAKTPVEMVLFYRPAGPGRWLRKRFVLKRSIKIGQTMFEILAAA